MQIFRIYWSYMRGVGRKVVGNVQRAEFCRTCLLCCKFQIYQLFSKFLVCNHHFILDILLWEFKDRSIDRYFFLYTHWITIYLKNNKLHYTLYSANTHNHKHIQLNFDRTVLCLRPPKIILLMMIYLNSFPVGIYQSPLLRVTCCFCDFHSFYCSDHVTAHNAHTTTSLRYTNKRTECDITHTVGDLRQSGWRLYSQSHLTSDMLVICWNSCVNSWFLII